MSQSAIVKGLVTISWGTSSGTAPFVPATITTIVESITIKPNTVNAKIETNPGATGVTVLLDDGFDATVKFPYDGNLEGGLPALGATVLLKLPHQATGSTQAAMATALGAATPFNCICVKPPIYDMDLARKKETICTLTLEYRPDVLA